MPVPGGEITTTEIWQAPVDVNEATKCDDCQGPLAIPADGSYDPTVFYERIHTVECVELNKDQAIPLKRPEVVEEVEDDLPELS